MTHLPDKRCQLNRSPNGLVICPRFCIIFSQLWKASFYEAFCGFQLKREIMRPGRRYSCALILLAALAVSFAVSPAHAHAVLLESTPALKSSVTGPNVPIKLRFNVRIDALRSRLTLIHPDGSAQALEISKQTPADTLSAEATGLAAGAYRLRWQVLASDGHITRGEIPFTVTAS
jgi:methionine-rich copper-binding protein CopC